MDRKIVARGMNALLSGKINMENTCKLYFSF